MWKLGPNISNKNLTPSQRRQSLRILFYILFHRLFNFLRTKAPSFFLIALENMKRKKARLFTFQNHDHLKGKAARDFDLSFS
jgi:hypothetical protein